MIEERQCCSISCGLSKGLGVMKAGDNLHQKPSGIVRLRVSAGRGVGRGDPGGRKEESGGLQRQKRVREKTYHTAADGGSSGRVGQQP